MRSSKVCVGGLPTSWSKVPQASVGRGIQADQQQQRVREHIPFRMKLRRLLDPLHRVYLGQHVPQKPVSSISSKPVLAWPSVRMSSLSSSQMRWLVCVMQCVCA